MTEAEWLAATDPNPMLSFLGLAATDRKLRLFACAHARCSASADVDERSRRAVEVAERFADGLVTNKEMEEAPSEALAVGGSYSATDAWLVVCNAKARDAAYATCDADAVEYYTCHGFPMPHPALIRDVFGNPFRPVAFDPHWRTADVAALARGIYEERAFDRLPLLADALMDAGCDHDDVLAHCRGDGPHFRGCWVVDLVLGKE